MLWRTRLLLLSLLTLSSSCGGDEDAEIELGIGENYGGTIEADNGPVAGATITVLDTSPLVQTTTNASGQFSLKLPEGESNLLIAADDHWGLSFRVRINPGQIIDDAEPELVTDAEFTQAMADLGRVVVASHGAVAIEFFASDQTLDLTGATATITAVSDKPFTLNPAEEIVESTVIFGGDDQDLFFTNIAPGTTQILTDGQTSSLICSAEFNTTTVPFAIRTHVLTKARVFCVAK